MLISDHYSLTLLGNAASFKKYITEHQPNVIVLDVMLPDGNGLDLCRQLKESSATQNIPVILMSAHQRVKLDEAGAAAFIAKPFDIKEFRKKVEQYL